MDRAVALWVVERAGWTRPRPHCHQTILYTALTNWDRPTPFSYCERCNNVLLRRNGERFGNVFIKIEGSPQSAVFWMRRLSITARCRA